MKVLKFKYLLILFASVALVTACGDDDNDEPEVSPLVGSYTINHAAVAETFNLSTVEGIEIPVPVGTDITEAIQNSLLSAVNCASIENSYVELRADNSIYMSCQGENPINGGTWEEVDESTLRLNMNSTAVPTAPAGVVLTVTDVVVNSAGITGKTSVPMPKEMFAAGLEGFGYTIAETPPVYNVTFSLDFSKK